MTSHQKQVKLSLQTKLLFVITLITALALIGNSALTYLNALNINRLASAQRIEELSAVFEKLIERSTQQFEETLSQVSVESYSAGSTNQKPPTLLSINPAIESITLHQFGGPRIQQWKTNAMAQTPVESLENRLTQQVTEQQQPVSRIYCSTTCYQVSYVPVVSSKGDLFILSAARNLEQIFVDFSSLTGADVALLRADSKDLTPILATNATTTRSLVNEIEASTSFISQSEPVYVRTSSGMFAASYNPLPTRFTISPLGVVILADDNPAQQQIQDSLRGGLIAAVIALCVTFVLTLLALRTALKKLVNLSNTIPMLSESNYDRLRDALQRYTHNPGYLDEVDQLNFTVLEVADALEEMEASVVQHRQQLVKKIAEHREAQDFNDVLVNDSPLVIAAHTLDGDIRLLNNYGRELAGWTRLDVEQRKISDLVLPDLSGHSITENLKPLIEGKQNRLQTEQLIRSTSGTVSDLTWVHARVKANNEPLILSVGLDITERRRTESRLRWLSKHDNVTGLLNREAFHEEAELLIQQYCDSHFVELLMLDIDKFSSINDMYGFHSGDAILQETARFIERLITCDTIIARTGANEFCALLIIDKDKFTESGHPVLNRPLHFFSVVDDDTIEISLSGILASHTQDGETVDELVSNSSAALRDLKPVNRGKINRISESVDNRALRQEKLQVHDSIVKALSEERFVLLYQPIYDLKQERISHCESLVRMRSEDGHLVSPAAFMDIAKENGLMARLDLLVLRMALEQLKVWERQGLDLKLSVNITAATFESDLFIKELKSLLLETGARPSHLIFEIVETEAINNLETARELCERLAALNVQIAFDDFGIGFTSFEYLRDLPVDYIKIDQSFIRYLYKRKSDQLLVKSMVDMALALGKKVVAEGVEDDGSADLLRNMGVHYLQGYYISRPRRVSELELDYTMAAPH